jgi:hypothetical protein
VRSVHPILTYEPALSETGKIMWPVQTRHVSPKKKKKKKKKAKAKEKRKRGRKKKMHCITENTPPFFLTLCTYSNLNFIVWIQPLAL